MRCASVTTVSVRRIRIIMGIIREGRWHGLVRMIIIGGHMGGLLGGVGVGVAVAVGVGGMIGMGIGDSSVLAGLFACLSVFGLDWLHDIPVSFLYICYARMFVIPAFIPPTTFQLLPSHGLLVLGYMPGDRQVPYQVSSYLGLSCLVFRRLSCQIWYTSN